MPVSFFIYFCWLDSYISYVIKLGECGHFWIFAGRLEQSLCQLLCILLCKANQQKLRREYYDKKQNGLCLFEHHEFDGMLDVTGTRKCS